MTAWCPTDVGSSLMAEDAENHAVWSDICPHSVSIFCSTDTLLAAWHSSACSAGESQSWIARCISKTHPPIYCLIWQIIGAFSRQYFFTTAAALPESSIASKRHPFFPLKAQSFCLKWCKDVWACMSMHCNACCAAGGFKPQFIPSLDGIATLFSRLTTAASLWVHLLAINLFAASRTYIEG